MAFPSPQRLAELLRHLQRQTMRCQQELNIIKSPDVEYEERTMFVKSCIDECWERYDYLKSVKSIPNAGGNHQPWPGA